MKAKKIALISVVAISLLYGAYLLKKSFFEKGYSSQDEEKQMLLTNYLIMIGERDTPANRIKYGKLPLEQIKKELGVED